MSEKETVRISCEVEWPQFFEKSEMSDKYECNLINLNKEATSILEAVDLEVRDGSKEGKPEKGKWIKAKSKFPPRVYDGRDDAPKGTPWDNQVRINNGSTAKVQLTAFSWEHKETKRSGRSAGLEVVKIMKLKEFEEGDDRYETDPFD